VSSKADPATRTYQAEIRVANPDALLKPGMLADIKLITRTMNDVVTIPGDAIIERDGESVVFVVDGNTASRRKLSVSERIGDRVVITDGVNPGEFLVVVGQHGLSDGNKVIITE
jgi:RND family efflux transporter MFP subunit